MKLVLARAALYACACLPLSAAAQFNFAITDRLIDIGHDSQSDSSHTIGILGTDVFYTRNNFDGASFAFRITGQASADSIIFTGEDNARVTGAVDLGFTLPNTALWNITVDTVYQGVLAAETNASASGSPLAISGSGAAAGLASSTPSPAFFTPITNGTRGTRTEASTSLANRLPGSATVTAGLELRATSNSGGNGGEAIASIGELSAMSAFSLNSVVLPATDGAFVTVKLVPHLNFSGQTLSASIITSSNEPILGFGTIDGSVLTPAGSSVIPNGTLQFGGTSRQIDLRGTQTIGAGSALMLTDQDTAIIAGTTNLSGGTIGVSAPGGLRLEGELRGFGTVQAAIQSTSAARITAQSGDLLLGDATRADGWAFSGVLDVGARRVTLRDADRASINGRTLLAGGTLAAANGFNVANEILGFGTVEGSVAGPSSGRITATDINPLILGDATRTDGWQFSGQLNIDAGGGVVTLRDADRAQLGQITRVDGRLQAPNGLLLQGGQLSGRGTIAADLVHRGMVLGSLVFEGPVSGSGGFGPGSSPVFRNTYSPGNSAARVAFLGDMVLATGSLLDIELGGLLRGAQYDALDVAGFIALHGGLRVSLIDGFELDYGLAFEIVDVGGQRTGLFTGLAEGGLVGSYGEFDLFVTYAGGDGNDVVLFTAAIPEPGTYALMLAGLALVILRRAGKAGRERGISTK